MSHAVAVGDMVAYAHGLYEVIERQGDLLVLAGLVDHETRTVRASCTVLDSDVTPVGRQSRLPLGGEG